jgi:hypothetical protein
MNKNIKRIVSKENTLLSNATRYFINSSMSSCWNCLELIEMLVEYSSANSGALLDSCTGLIEVGLEQSPDLLLLGFAQIEVSTFYFSYKSELLFYFKQN